MDIFGGFIAIMIVILVLMCGSGQFKFGPHIDWKSYEKEHREAFYRTYKDKYKSEEKLKKACDADYKNIRIYSKYRYHL